MLAWPFLLAGMTGAVALAFVYQYLLEWIPLIYINFLVTLGLGLVLGSLGVVVVKSGSIRNALVAALFGILFAAAAISAKYYFQYTSWISTITTAVMQENRIDSDQYDEVRKEVAARFDFAEHIKYRTEEGFDVGRPGRKGGMPIKGVLVFVVWLIELVAVGWFAVSLPMAAAGQPYSEKLASWANEEELIMTLPVTDPEMVEKIRSATSVEELLQIPIPKTDQSLQFAIYRVNSIPGEEMEDAYLSVDLVAYSTNAKGETEAKTVSLVKHAILTSANREQLVENASLLQEAMAAYRESLENAAANPDDEGGRGETGED
jgi:hypothetical protein